jgi:hypothetical protein
MEQEAVLRRSPINSAVSLSAPLSTVIFSYPRNRASKGVWITAIAPGVVLCGHMEKPAVMSPRVYSRHRVIIKKAFRKLKVSEAEVVRRALETFAF